MIFYYILRDPHKPHHTKLGITKDPPRRLREYRTAAPGCAYLAVYEIPDRKIEKRILDLLRDRFMVQSEYVHCRPEIVKNIVEGYFVDHDISVNSVNR